MKIFIYALLAFAIASTFASDICDPDTDGQPECTDANTGQAFRHFWDPTHYWLCSAANVEPEAVRCPSGSLFDSAQKDCIPWRSWEWTHPCPEYE